MAISLDYIRQLCMEAESSHLDYKREQYSFVGATDSEKEKLLKDILAMANSFRSQVAYILIGVAQQESGAGEIKGIPQSSYIDDAKLQQFVNEKTNRLIEFQSYSVPVDDKKIIQVIEIPIQKQRPYYLRKQFGSINKNSVMLRMGSSTRPAYPDEIANMGKEEIIQRNQREIEVSLIVPQNSVETINFAAIDVVLEGDAPAEANGNSYDVFDLCRPVSFEKKYNYIRDVFRTYRVDIALRNKSALSAEQLEVETLISHCSGECVCEKDSFPDRPSVFLPLNSSILNRVSPIQQRVLHPDGFESSFESRYFKVNHDGEFTLDVTVLGKDMQPIHKTFHINVFIRKCPLPAVAIEQFFELIEDENSFIHMMAKNEDNKS